MAMSRFTPNQFRRLIQESEHNEMEPKRRLWKSFFPLKVLLAPLKFYCANNSLLFCYQRELCRGSIVNTIMAVKGAESYVTRFDRLVKHDLFHFIACVEPSLRYRLSPVFAIIAYVYFVIPDAAIACVLTRQDREAFHELWL